MEEDAYRRLTPWIIKLLKPMSKVATVTTQITFGGMMSVFSGLFGDKDSGFQHKIFMLLMFFAFLSSFSVNLLTVSTPKAATQITVIRILNTYFLLPRVGSSCRLLGRGHGRLTLSKILMCEKENKKYD